MTGQLLGGNNESNMPDSAYLMKYLDDIFHQLAVDPAVAKDEIESCTCLDIFGW